MLLPFKAITAEPTQPYPHIMLKVTAPSPLTSLQCIPHLSYLFIRFNIQVAFLRFICSQWSTAHLCTETFLNCNQEVALSKNPSHAVPTFPSSISLCYVTISVIHCQWQLILNPVWFLFTDCLSTLLALKITPVFAHVTRRHQALI